MKELSLEEAALACAQGKRVECLTVNQTEYLPVSSVGTSDGIVSPTCFGERNEERIRYKFRLAPEPPAKKWRPYTRSQIEKHLGAQVQHKGRGYSAIIIAVFEEAVHIGMWNYTLHELLENFTWSDGSPCGVEVDA